MSPEFKENAQPAAPIARASPVHTNNIQGNASYHAPSPHCSSNIMDNVSERYNEALRSEDGSCKHQHSDAKFSPRDNVKESGPATHVSGFARVGALSPPRARDDKRMSIPAHAVSGEHRSADASRATRMEAHATPDTYQRDTSTTMASKHRGSNRLSSRSIYLAEDTLKGNGTRGTEKSRDATFSPVASREGGDSEDVGRQPGFNTATEYERIVSRAEQSWNVDARAVGDVYMTHKYTRSRTYATEFGDVDMQTHAHTGTNVQVSSHESFSMKYVRRHQLDSHASSKGHTQANPGLRSSPNADKSTGINNWGGRLSPKPFARPFKSTFMTGDTFTTGLPTDIEPDSNAAPVTHMRSSFCAPAVPSETAGYLGEVRCTSPTNTGQSQERTDGVFKSIDKHPNSKPDGARMAGSASGTYEVSRTRYGLRDMYDNPSEDKLHSTSRYDRPGQSASRKEALVEPRTAETSGIGAPNETNSHRSTDVKASNTTPAPHISKYDRKLHQPNPLKGAAPSRAAESRRTQSMPLHRKVNDATYATLRDYAQANPKGLAGKPKGSGELERRRLSKESWRHTHHHVQQPAERSSAVFGNAPTTEEAMRGTHRGLSGLSSNGEKRDANRAAQAGDETTEAVQGGKYLRGRRLEGANGNAADRNAPKANVAVTSDAHGGVLGGAEVRTSSDRSHFSTRRFSQKYAAERRANALGSRHTTGDVRTQGLGRTPEHAHTHAHIKKDTHGMSRHVPMAHAKSRQHETQTGAEVTGTERTPQDECTEALAKFGTHTSLHTDPQMPNGISQPTDTQAQVNVDKHKHVHERSIPVVGQNHETADVAPMSEDSGGYDDAQPGSSPVGACDLRTDTSADKAPIKGHTQTLKAEGYDQAPAHNLTNTAFTGVKPAAPFPSSWGREEGVGEKLGSGASVPLAHGTHTHTHCTAKAIYDTAAAQESTQVYHETRATAEYTVKSRSTEEAARTTISFKSKLHTNAVPIVGQIWPQSLSFQPNRPSFTRMRDSTSSQGAHSARERRRRQPKAVRDRKRRERRRGKIVFGHSYKKPPSATLDFPAGYAPSTTSSSSNHSSSSNASETEGDAEIAHGVGHSAATLARRQSKNRHGQANVRQANVRVGAMETQAATTSMLGAYSCPEDRGRTGVPGAEGYTQDCAPKVSQTGSSPHKFARTCTSSIENSYIHAPPQVYGSKANDRRNEAQANTHAHKHDHGPTSVPVQFASVPKPHNNNGDDEVTKTKHSNSHEVRGFSTKPSNHIQASEDKSGYSSVSSLSDFGDLENVGDYGFDSDAPPAPSLPPTPDFSYSRRTPTKYATKHNTRPLSETLHHSVRERTGPGAGMDAETGGVGVAGVSSGTGKQTVVFPTGRLSQTSFGKARVSPPMAATTTGTHLGTQLHERTHTPSHAHAHAPHESHTRPQVPSHLPAQAQTHSDRDRDQIARYDTGAYTSQQATTEHQHQHQSPRHPHNSLHPHKRAWSNSNIKSLFDVQTFITHTTATSRPRLETSSRPNSAERELPAGYSDGSSSSDRASPDSLLNQPMGTNPSRVVNDSAGEGSRRGRVFGEERAGNACPTTDFGTATNTYAGQSASGEKPKRDDRASMPMSRQRFKDTTQTHDTADAAGAQRDTYEPPSGYADIAHSQSSEYSMFGISGSGSQLAEKAGKLLPRIWPLKRDGQTQGGLEGADEHTRYGEATGVRERDTRKGGVEAEQAQQVYARAHQGTASQRLRARPRPDAPERDERVHGPPNALDFGEKGDDVVMSADEDVPVATYTHETSPVAGRGRIDTQPNAYRPSQSRSGSLRGDRRGLSRSSIVSHSSPDSADSRRAQAYTHTQAQTQTQTQIQTPAQTRRQSQNSVGIHAHQHTHPRGHRAHTRTPSPVHPYSRSRSPARHTSFSVYTNDDGSICGDGLSVEVIPDSPPEDVTRTPTRQSATHQHHHPTQTQPFLHTQQQKNVAEGFTDTNADFGNGYMTDEDVVYVTPESSPHERSTTAHMHTDTDMRRRRGERERDNLAQSDKEVHNVAGAWRREGDRGTDKHMNAQTHMDTNIGGHNGTRVSGGLSGRAGGMQRSFEALAAYGRLSSRGDGVGSNRAGQGRQGLGGLGQEEDMGDTGDVDRYSGDAEMYSNLSDSPVGSDILAQAYAQGSTQAWPRSDSEASPGVAIRGMGSGGRHNISSPKSTFTPTESPGARVNTTIDARTKERIRNLSLRGDSPDPIIVKAPHSPVYGNAHSHAQAHAREQPTPHIHTGTADGRHKAADRHGHNHGEATEYKWRPHSGDESGGEHVRYCESADESKTSLQAHASRSVDTDTDTDTDHEAVRRDGETRGRGGGYVRRKSTAAEKRGVFGDAPGRRSNKYGSRADSEARAQFVLNDAAARGHGQDVNAGAQHMQQPFEGLPQISGREGEVLGKFGCAYVDHHRDQGKDRYRNNDISGAVTSFTEAIDHIQRNTNCRHILNNTVGAGDNVATHGDRDETDSPKHGLMTDNIECTQHWVQDDPIDGPGVAQTHSPPNSTRRMTPDVSTGDGIPGPLASTCEEIDVNMPDIVVLRTAADGGWAAHTSDPANTGVVRYTDTNTEPHPQLHTNDRDQGTHKRTDTDADRGWVIEDIRAHPSTNTHTHTNAGTRERSLVLEPEQTDAERQGVLLGLLYTNRGLCYKDMDDAAKAMVDWATAAVLNQLDLKPLINLARLQVGAKCRVGVVLVKIGRLTFAKETVEQGVHRSETLKKNKLTDRHAKFINNLQTEKARVEALLASYEYLWKWCEADMKAQASHSADPAPAPTPPHTDERPLLAHAEDLHRECPSSVVIGLRYSRVLRRMIKNVERALVVLEELLQRRKKGNDAYTQGDYKHAIQHYTTAVELAQSNARYRGILLNNRAAAYWATKDLQHAVNDCKTSLQLYPTYLATQKRYASLLVQSGDEATGLRRLNALLTEHPNDEDIKKRIKRANDCIANKAKEAKVNVEKHLEAQNHYEVLGVPTTATESQIKKAHRQMVRKWHPDKWQTKGESAQAESNVRFKRVQKAYEILSNYVTRRTYDLTTRAETYTSQRQQSHPAPHAHAHRHTQAHTYPHAHAQAANRRNSAYGGVFGQRSSHTGQSSYPRNSSSYSNAKNTNNNTYNSSSNMFNNSGARSTSWAQPTKANPFGSSTAKPPTHYPSQARPRYANKDYPHEPKAHTHTHTQPQHQSQPQPQPQTRGPFDTNPFKTTTANANGAENGPSKGTDRLGFGASASANGNNLPGSVFDNINSRYNKFGV
ncbi:hypothetical protein SARC_01947 [Sphaeroforma arctica JP610]|uniref:J domain-containing protein n=1 Tax=Sphaeroforma arctica JP610 TaxID=667725 RepID=A0A0L0GAH5_9EUKA|nr:hypothetical protein SARC_01947 [Sphaeroforma arctica JP610]KNC85909.1 hypothetical protein SARC_01947 [Sphaeroforma arctica JP610]|eukprot:XP_014159811.1 hypothetical protein SARC_01947 [Sphaeroforma arctica JP610]